MRDSPSHYPPPLIRYRGHRARPRSGAHHSGRRFLLVALLLIASATALGAHDLFLKLDTFFLEPNSSVRILLLNGTFVRSENSVTAERVRDLRVAGSHTVYFPGKESWNDRGDTTMLRITTGGEGTYTVGVSTRPKDLLLNGKEFNAYLREEGLTDVIAARRREEELNTPARERYSKHVKAVVQVGAQRSNGHSRSFDYPAEIIPLDNPYRLGVGESFTVQCLMDGKPVERQVVIAGYQRGGGKNRPRQVTLKTNAQGLATIRLTSRGRWFAKFVAIRRVNEEAIDYESKWATLTWEVK